MKRARRTATVIPLNPGASAARPRPGGPVKSSAPLLDRGMTIAEAFRAVMRANLDHLRANDLGVLEGRDPEYLHQVRVALRRLRSAIGLFAPLLAEEDVAPLRAELKWIAASLGPARDWDVFLTETLPPITAEFGPHRGLERLAARAKALRGAAGARARRAVRSARYDQLALRLETWLESGDWLDRAGAPAREALLGPVLEFASGVLERRYDRVRKRGRSLGGLRAAERHRLRIAIKKFRYAADFFAGLYDETAARAALKRLARLQDILGAMNDASAVEELLARAFRTASTRPSLEAKGLLIGWSRGRTTGLKRELKTAWKEFRAADKFW